jgi:predicted acylesterase/phospholipase RssA
MITTLPAPPIVSSSTTSSALSTVQVIAPFTIPSPRRKKIIASFDGGGERGILSALLIASMEKATGKLARETFDFVGGTSTGALLAAAIATGMPASKMVHIYMDRIREIFAPGPPLSFASQVVTGHKYHIDNLRKVLVSEFGPASDWKLNDCPIEVLLTAVGLADGKPWYFVKDKPGASLVGNMSLVDCACASAAAPTYFDPMVMGTPVNGKVVDGGVGMTGNPVYQAAVECFEYLGYAPADTIILSFGTGRNPPSVANPKTLADWIKWVIDDLVGAPASFATELVRRHYPTAMFYRLNAPMPHMIEMDDTSKMGVLRDLGTAYAATVNWVALLNGTAAS